MKLSDHAITDNVDESNDDNDVNDGGGGDITKSMLISEMWWYQPGLIFTEKSSRMDREG